MNITKSLHFSKVEKKKLRINLKNIPNFSFQKKPLKNYTARKYGYKLKKDFFVLHAYIRKGSFNKPQINIRRQVRKKSIKKKYLKKSLKNILNQRILKKYKNMFILGSYFLIHKNGKNWYEIILKLK